MKELFVLIDRFIKFQMDNGEPYSFDLLGLMEWIEFEEKSYDFPLSNGKESK